MSVNKNALIRYKTIDKCLQNRYRKWTLEDLIDACSDALYEYEDIDKGVSKRSVQADIQMMRSDKLGYNAPIIVVDRKYYTYEDPNYSITNIPITDQDLGKLMEAVEFLKQFQGFSHFRELGGMVQKLEDHVYAQKTNQKPVIDFEKNENLKGIEHLDELYQAIIHKKTILLTYQSFKARQSSSFEFFPYLLKEFRNRWFLIGLRKGEEQLLNLALDRIISIEKGKSPYQAKKDFDADQYFKDAIGVSVSPKVKPSKVLLFVIHRHAPYILTKPLHHSQKLVEKDHYGITISLDVQLNFELEKVILGFGDGVKVISPERLKRKIRDRLVAGLDLYNTELNESSLVSNLKKLQHKGFCIFNHIYSQRAIKKIGSLIHKRFFQDSSKAVALRNLLIEIPQLKAILFNKNLVRIVTAIDPEAFLVKAIYFNKSPQVNWAVNWHQDNTIHVKEKQESEGFTGWIKKEDSYQVIPPEAISKRIFSVRIHLDDTNASNGTLKVIAGSQNKRMSTEEIRLITENCSPFTVEVGSGGIQIMKPLLLHASSKSLKQKRRRVIHLEFTSHELPKGLEWAEKERI